MSFVAKKHVDGRTIHLKSRRKVFGKETRRFVERGRRGPYNQAVRTSVLRSIALPFALTTAVVAGACGQPIYDDSGPRGTGSKDGPQSEVDQIGQSLTPGPAMVRNLSNREFLNIVSDLIGERLPLELQKQWTPTTQISGFDAVSWSGIDTKAIREREETLQVILEKIVASPKVMTCQADTAEKVAYDACAKSIVEAFVTRAWARPLSPAESASLAKTYGDAVEAAKPVFADAPTQMKEGVRIALGSALLSPQFLTRSEAPPSADFDGVRDLNAFELASRLSFTFTGSVPDDELWAKALDGSLTDEKVLLEQTNRLLEGRLEDFVKNFVGQWLDFRAYDDMADDAIETAMWNETWRTMAEVVQKDMPITSIVSPGFTYLNKALATHYGLPTDGLTDDTFTRVVTGDRGGILQQGSWLSISASPLKTSPMHRGRMVQDRLLCRVVPPPDSELFAQIQSVSESIPPDATVKQRVDAHRNAGEACFGCHQYMDPIGLGLEVYDQFGKFRTTYADTGYPVEPKSDILGRPFATIPELNTILAGLPDYATCAAEKVSIYALRRAVDVTKPTSPEAKRDQPMLDYLTMPEGGKAPTVKQLVTRLVKSVAFRKVNHGVQN